MNDPRSDLGPRLRGVLASQRPNLSAQGRRDWLAAQGCRGGTRKIADLPRVCTSPRHDPPSMMVYEPGVWEHVCPDCGDRQIFTVTRPTL